MIYLSVLLVGCSCEKEIELEILTKEINCLDIEASEFTEYLKLDGLAPNGARTVIQYKITNNGNKTYYFNIDNYKNNLKYSHIMIDRAFLSIEYNGESQSPKLRQPSSEMSADDFYLKYLNYNDYLSYKRGVGKSKNFILHPKETLYFEWFVILPYGNVLETTNYTIDLNSSKEYSASVFIHSDTINYKKILSRTDLKTIEDNGYEIYNGTIKSKNRIPIVFNNSSN